MPLDALSGLPDVFLPYQQRLWHAVDTYGVVVIEKSRRTGYSWALGAIAAGHCSVQTSEGGSDVIYMGYDKAMTLEFVGYVAEWAKVMQIAASEVEEFVFKTPEKPDADIAAFRIRFASGSELIALPSVARAVRGKQGLVILDEAAFIDDLENVLTAALALRMWGGKIVICSTHKGDINPFAVLVNDIRAGKWPYHLERLTFYEAVAEGLVRRIFAKTKREWSPEAEAAWIAETLAEFGDRADEELHVIPQPSTGAFLASTLLEARAADGIPVLRWECDAAFKTAPIEVRERVALAWCRDVLLPVLDTLDPALRHVMGEDFGRVRDITVLWPLAIQRDLVRRTPFVVELRNVPFEQQKQVLFYVCDRLPRLGAMKLDAGGNGAYLAEAATQRYGSLVGEVLLSEPWYRENMPALKDSIEQGTMNLPADDELMSDFRLLKLVRGVGRVPETRRNDEGKSRHGDAAIAACMAIAASRAEPEEYGYRAAPPPHLRPGGGDDAYRPRRAIRELRGSL